MIHNKQTQEQDTRDKAIEWWNGLSEKKKEKLCYNHYPNWELDVSELKEHQIEFIYEVNLPKPTPQDTLCVEGESLNVGFTGGDWVNDGCLIIGDVDSSKYDGQGGVVVCDMNPQTEYETASINDLIGNCKLVANAPAMYRALKRAVEWIEDLGGKDGTGEISKMKALLSNIDNK